MKATAFILVITALSLSMSCSTDSESQETKQIPAKEVIKEEPLRLEAGKEARTTRKAALWSDSELRIVESPNWANAEASTRLKGGATVYVLDIGEEYARVKTIIGNEGHIVKELLSPVRHSVRDSTEYFEAKQIGRINTYVDGMDVGKVNLWAHKNTKDRIVTSIGKDEKVAILEQDGMYVQVATVNGDIGWCLKDFVRR